MLPWGGVIEDFLRPIGLDRTAFATGMSGGWLFGYADALERYGIETVLFVFSADARSVERIRNPRTGRLTAILPQSSLHRRLRQWPGDGDDPDRPYLPRQLSPIADLVRYTATPTAALGRVLLEENVSALMVQEYETPRFDRVVALGRRLGLTVFASFQGAPPPTNVVERLLRRRTVPRAAGLVIASSGEATRVRNSYDLPAERIADIPNPLNPEVWFPEPRAVCRAALGIPEDALVAISHGRIELHRKGLDLLIEAWRRLTSARPEQHLRLHLVGSGRDDDRLAEILAADPVPGLHWQRGYINDRDLMRRQLSAADLYVLPSRHEGFPVAPLEALACGLPVVAANAPGVSDIFARGKEHGGIVVPTCDSGALQAALEKLLFDPSLRADLASRSRERILSHFSLDAVGERLATFLSR